MKRRFELSDGSSAKFWEVDNRGAELTVRFGRIGTEGQTKTKKLASAAAATKEADKLIAQKTKKGYAPASGTKGSTKKTGAKESRQGKPAYLNHSAVKDVLTVVPAGKELPELLGRFIVWASDLGDEELFDELGIEGFTAEEYEDGSLADEVVEQVDAATCSFTTLGEGSRITLWWHGDAPPAVVLIDSEGQDEVLADSVERFLVNWSRRKSGVGDLDWLDEDPRPKSEAFVAWLKAEGVKAPRARETPDFVKWRASLGGGRKAKRSPSGDRSPRTPPQDMAERVIACLGLLQTEEPLASLLEELGVDMSQSRTTDQLRNLSVPEFGYLLRFEKPKEWRSPHGDYVAGNKAALAKGKARMLVGAEFCQEGYKAWNNGKGGYDTYARFVPKLPFGVTFADTPAKVDKRGFDDGARRDDVMMCGVMRVHPDDGDKAIAPGKIKYVHISLYNHDMYRARHWTSKAALTAAIRAKSSDLAESIYDGWDARGEETRQLLASLLPKDLAMLAGLDLRCWQHLAEGAWAAHENDALEDSLALFDALVASPMEGESQWVGVQATYVLITKLESGKADRKRAKAYLERYQPLGEDNTAVLLNLANLQMALKDHSGAIATLRRAVVLGDPRIQGQLAADNDFDPYRNKPAFKALASLQPEYPIPLRNLKTALVVRDGLLTKTVRDVGIEPLRGSFAKGVAKRFKGAKDKHFATFAGAPDGGLWAQWRRDPEALAADHPIVVVHSGRIAVYAANLAGFMAQLACGYRFDQALAAGFEAGAKAWRRPKKLPPLSEHKKVKARLKKFDAMDKGAAKLDPKQARDAALALNNELRVAVVG